MAKKSNTEEKEKKKTLYTLKLTDEQMDKLKNWCDSHMLAFYEVDYARFAFKGDKVNIVAYESGKLVIQGKKTEEFVTYVLEAEITMDPRMGYEEVHNPEWFEAHAGLDESGKGDLFGPLITACVIADGDIVRSWMKAGVQDSKKVTTDAAILKLEKEIRRTKGVVVKTAWVKMEKYNVLYHKFGDNLNKMMAWLHSKSLEEALKVRRVDWGMLDQFSKQPLVQKYFKDDPFDLRMQTKAESDPVVAAASICARAEYIRQMKNLSDLFGEKLLRGASARVKEQGKSIVQKNGADALGSYAKLHFKTSYEILDLPVPAKPAWKKY